MRQHDSRFNLIFRLAVGSFCAAIVLTIIAWAFVGCGAVKFIESIERNGLKSVVNSVWNGTGK